MNDSSFTIRLLRWYAANRRELPWRQTTDPYRIWISEVILQQTRVAQGYDYYRRFVSRFPNVEALARASEDDVLAQWQGLGYYSRARNLHCAARQIAEMGRFPSTYDEIRTLRGVGDYTAAAIASLAFGLPYAVVDGNVYRVLARHFGIDSPIDTAGGKKLFAALAQEMLDVHRPAEYNQAIMDFGALQCVPQSPACLTCVLSDTCQARADGLVGQLPRRTHVTRVRERFLTYIYTRCGGHILLERRPAGDIWQGLYQVPMRETTQPMPAADVRRWAGDGRLTLLRQGFVHQLTHQRLHADLYLLDAPQRPAWPGVWVPETDRADYAVPRLIEELFALVGEP